MKIVQLDNFGRDYMPDALVAENIASEQYANVMCKALNDVYSAPQSSMFFVVRPDAYVLQRVTE